MSRATATAAAPAPAPATAAARARARAPRPVAAPAPRRGGGAPVTAPLRLAHAARGLPDARLLDRLIRGRLWVGIIAAGLIGIVFMQVSLLKLNAGIGRAVETQATLERQNATLRAEVSRLSSGERIQQVARELGMVMPPAGEVGYLDAREPGLGARAADALTPPAPEVVERARAATTSQAREAAAASAQAPPGTTPATGSPPGGPATPPAQAAARSAAAAPPAVAPEAP